MQSLPLILQIRKNCIIVYNDFSVLEKSSCTTERKKIEISGKFTSSAQQKMKKHIDLWEYYREEKIKISFITLTYSSNISQKTKIESDIKTWIEKMLYRYGKFNYIWKLELQKNGNPHFHLIIDKETDWRIVRGIWNKTQKEQVDKYQLKMKEKYRNGYFYDKNLLNKKGEIIEEEIQKERYRKGHKANWRNPNSTDVKIIDTNTENITSYINKYVNKKEEEIEENQNIKFNRWHGCNDEIRTLRYPTIKENEITHNEMERIFSYKIKDIKDKKENIVCSVHEKIIITNTEEIIKKTIEENRKKISYNSNAKNNLLQKEENKYRKLFEI